MFSNALSSSFAAILPMKCLHNCIKSWFYLWNNLSYCFLGRTWYGKETTIICIKTIYLLYFEYIICHLFSYLISWTNISSNTILFIIINSVMVICRGAACIFFWEIYMLSFFCCVKKILQEFLAIFKYHFFVSF